MSLRTLPMTEASTHHMKLRDPTEDPSQSEKRGNGVLMEGQVRRSPTNRRRFRDTPVATPLIMEKRHDRWNLPATKAEMSYWIDCLEKHWQEHHICEDHKLPSVQQSLHGSFGGWIKELMEAKAPNNWEELKRMIL